MQILRDERLETAGWTCLIFPTNINEIDSFSLCLMPLKKIIEKILEKIIDENLLK